MWKILSVIAIVTVSFTAPSAFGENAVPQAREQLAKLWSPGQTQQIATSPMQRDNQAGMHESGRVTGTWDGNYRAGRVHEPAGH